MDYGDGDWRPTHVLQVQVRIVKYRLTLVTGTGWNSYPTDRHIFTTFSMSASRFQRYGCTLYRWSVILCVCLVTVISQLFSPYKIMVCLNVGRLRNEAVTVCVVSADKVQWSVRWRLCELWLLVQTVAGRWRHWRLGWIQQSLSMDDDDVESVQRNLRRPR